MLQLLNVVKEYSAGDMKIEALKGVDLSFRTNEFVAILGPSGCGKTTMLNIIGGLDRYTDGDLRINGISTKKYKDVDWDIYRNNSIGFVFQNYNLIPHQSVLSNVELAMTLAGVSKSERKKRAAAALEKVGLGDQLTKKPNQLSGGQMQRVAIARALVNNPDILLADEPTGALDSETSVQIMEILKEIASERLVIMVTHNPELADRYSTRIVRLLDGNIISDSNPFTPEPESEQERKKKKISMSLITALSLSMNNLMTKKARTFLTAFAGSIGIIGIALILSLSNGMQNYIDSMQEDTLSTYPLEITSQTVDIAGMMTAMMSARRVDRSDRDPDLIYSGNIMTEMIRSISAQMTKNDLNQFKTALETDSVTISELTNAVQYAYDLDLQIYKADTSRGVYRVNPNSVFSGMSANSGGNNMMSSNSSMNMGFPTMNSDIWTEMLGNRPLLEKQYDLLAGSWPSAYDEVVLVVNEHNELSDMVLYSLGILNQDELDAMLKKVMSGEKIEAAPEVDKYSYEQLLDLTFKLVINTDVYAKENGHWVDKSDRDTHMRPIIEDSLDIKVVGILRPNEEVTAAAIDGSVAYTWELTEYVIGKINESAIVQEQKANPDVNVFTAMPFDMEGYTEDLTMDEIRAFIASMPADEREQMQNMLATMTEEEAITFFSENIPGYSMEKSTYEDNMLRMGVVDVENPSSISIYPKDFQAKESITQYIDDYNARQKDSGHEELIINYTDIMAIMMSSVTSITNMITYVLIAFVAISLVVSSIMIGIITYISVLERTKEIGILRSIGASKRDISRVFNAETIIVGFVAGTLGILITVLLNIPINMIIKSLAGISGIAALPLYGAVSLVAISVILTVIAGLLPSKIAARKDPVEALRSE